MLRQSLLRDERVCLPVPQIPRRRANQLGNLVRVLKLGAIHLDPRPRVPEQNLRRGFHNARLPRPGRPQEQQVAHRTSLRAHPRAEHLVEIHQSAHALFLADDPSAQLLLKSLRLGAVPFRVESLTHCPHSHALLPTKTPQFQPFVTNERAWAFASQGEIRVVHTGYHWDQRLGASAVAGAVALARARWTFSRVWRT